MEKIEILGKEHDVNFPDEFPTDDFEKFIETYQKYPDQEPDFFEMMEEFSAFLFMKHNKDLFVKMMVEESIKLFREGIHNWFEREIPI